MSDYCTGCKHIARLPKEEYTEWRCMHDKYVGYLLQSLCGNPIKLFVCKKEDWYLKKETKQEKEIDTKEMIAVMQAYIDGKQIEYKDKKSNQWLDTQSPVWDWFDCDYRIKPAPTYRPYNAEEMKALIGKQIKNHKHTVLVIAYDKERSMVYAAPGGWYDAQFLLDNVQMADGSPCGVLEE